MRKLGVLAVLFLALSLARPEKAEAASSGLPEFAGIDMLHGKTPDKNAKNWIMLITLTARSSAPPIFLVSPTAIDVKPPQILIQLSKAEYASFDRYTRTYRCQRTSGDYMPPEVLEATEHASGKTRVLCRMSPPEACHYLSGIQTVHAIDWMERKWDPLRNVGARIGCK